MKISLLETSGYVASVMTFIRGDILQTDFKKDFGI